MKSDDLNTFNGELKEISTVLDSTFKSIRSIATLKNIKLESNIEAQELFIDPKKIQTVISKLLTNSVHFSNENSKVEITGRVIDHHYEISIRDYGTGIPSNLMSKIFHSPEYLSQCRDLTELNQGEIRLFSTPNKITEFTISLPLPGAANKVNIKKSA